MRLYGGTNIKISKESIRIIQEIYNLTKDSYCNTAKIKPKDLAKNLNMTREFVHKCFHYLKEKELLFVDPAFNPYVETEVPIEIKITAKGIDLIESKMSNLNRKIPENEIHNIAIDIAKHIPVEPTVWECKKIVEYITKTYNGIYDELLEYNKSCDNQ